MTDPRVLIVDDDLEMIAFVQEILSLVPCEILIAQSGEEGLTVLSQELQNKRVVDAMLLDVVMPGADGFRILQQMKSDLLLQQVPVILVTGIGEVHNKARGLQMGADDYITKPFDPQELLARINAVLRVRRSEQMLRRRNEELAALNELSRMISASLDLDQVLSSALEGLQHLLDVEALVFVLNDEDAGEWVIRGSRTPEGTWLEGRVMPTLEGSAAKALEQNSPVLEAGVEDSFWNQTLDTPRMDLLYVPLLIHEEPVGLLIVLGNAGTLNRDHLPLLEHVATTVSVAVENARLYGDLSAFAEELERSQNQLVQAEKMAAVGRLAASIAHEINNPLQAIQNSMHLAIHPNVDLAKRDYYLQMAQQEVERLVHIVRRMLDFYRPASSIMESLDVNQAVNDALAIANKRLEQAKIQVAARLSNELPTVRGSRNQLTQVFLNIIINAVEAMEEGGQFWIGTAYHAERDQVVTAFRDSGPGIPPEVREHLFEPFHTTKPTGTGLGLAISYGIVERHGGQIEVESPPGGGATFIVRLPRHKEES